MLWANVGILSTSPNLNNDPLELLKKTKRIILCTACGTIKATT